MITKRICCLILFVIMSGILFSQNAKQDLLKLNMAYNSYNKITYSTKYIMIGLSNQKVLETYQFDYKKNGSDFVSKSKDEEFLVNKLYMIIVDHDDKEVHLSQNTNKKEGSLQKMINDKTNFPLYLDTLMSIYKSINKISVLDPNIRAYKFEMIQGEYAFVDIYIDVKKWLIKELYLYPNETTIVNNVETSVMLKVEFLDYNLKPPFTNDFSESRFLEKRNGKFILKQNYSRYKLYDQTF